MPIAVEVEPAVKVAELLRDLESKAERLRSLEAEGQELSAQVSAGSASAREEEARALLSGKPFKPDKNLAAQEGRLAQITRALSDATGLFRAEVSQLKPETRLLVEAIDRHYEARLASGRVAAYKIIAQGLNKLGEVIGRDAALSALNPASPESFPISDLAEPQMPTGCPVAAAHLAFLESAHELAQASDSDRLIFEAKKILAEFKSTEPAKKEK